MGAKVPEIRAVLGEHEKSRRRTWLDLDARFPRGLPRQVYSANRRHLKGWHVVVNVGDYSYAKKDLASLKKYVGLDIEIRKTSRIQLGAYQD